LKKTRQLANSRPNTKFFLSSFHTLIFLKFNTKNSCCLFYIKVLFFLSKLYRKKNHHMSLDSLLSKATSNDDSPPPGYVFVELIKLLNNDVTQVDKCSDALYKRLQRNEASVKWKVLLVMKQVARGGRIEFRRALQRNNAAVKAEQSFKGPPHPLLGDEPYRKVRDAAKDALEAMFASEPAPSHSSQANQMGNRISGYSGGGGGGGGSDSRFPPPTSGSDPRFPPPNASSDSRFPPPNRPGGASGSGSGGSGMFGFGGSGGGGGGSGSTGALPGQPGYDPNSVLHQPPVTTGNMSGFGNYDPKKDVSVTEGIFDAMKSAFTVSLTTVPPSSKQVQQQRDQQGSYSNRGMGQGGQIPPPDNRYPGGGSAGGYGGGGSFSGSGSSRMPGQAGGGWGDNGSNNDNNGGQQFSNVGGRRAHMPPGSYGSGVGGAAKDGGYERGLVEDVTAQGGVRPIPDKDKLAKFLNDAKTLDMSVVGPILDERIAMGLPGGSSENISAKAIAVVEAIANGGVTLEAPRKYLSDHCDVLLDMLESGDAKPSLRESALRALKALGVDVERPASLPAPASGGGGGNSYSSSSSVSAQKEVDLLGLDFGAAPVQPIQNIVSPVQATNAFGGSAVVSSSSATGFSFGAMGVVSPPQVPAQASLGGGGLDMFGGLTVGGASGGANTNNLGVTPAPSSQAPPPLLPAVSSTPFSFPTTAQSSTSGVSSSPFNNNNNTGFVQQPMQMQMQQPVQQAQVLPQQQQQQMSSQLQQQLLVLQQQIQGLTMQVTQNPASAASVMPMLMQLQQQQSQLMMMMAQQQQQGVGVGFGGGMSSLGGNGGGGGGGGMMMMGQQQQQQPMMMMMGQQQMAPMGGIGGSMSSMQQQQQKPKAPDAFAGLADFQ
jgi:hypothetical protein